MDWSYIAGYFDGEGHIAFHVQKTRKQRTRGLFWYNSHRESLEAMRQFMGAGYIHSHKRQPHQNYNVYNLSITKRSEMIHVLDSMIPHLIVKRKAAQAMREHLETIKDMPDAYGKAAAISTEQLKQWYYDEGKSCADIAKIVGVSIAAINQAMRVRGLTRRPAGAGWLKGKKKAPETIARMRASRQKLWQDPEFRKKQMHNLMDWRKPNH